MPLSIYFVYQIDILWDPGFLCKTIKITSPQDNTWSLSAATLVTFTRPHMNKYCKTRCDDENTVPS